MTVDNKNGVIDDTQVNIKKMALKMGKNPIEGNILIKNLKNFPIKADLMAKVDLEDLLNIFPIDSLEMKGTYDLQLHADGYYDSATHQFPKIDSKMTLKDGYIKSAHFPLPIEQINVNAGVVNTTGKMQDTYVKFPDISMLMNKEKFVASGQVNNLDDITWDFKAKGKVDLGAIMAIYPVDSTEIKGIIDANIATRGKMSDVEAEKYSKLYTSGDVVLSKFHFVNPAIPQGVDINKGVMTFNPKKIELKSLNGKINSSDFSLKGWVSNYLAYGLKDETLNGKLDLNSKFFDLNQFITEEEAVEEKGESKKEEAPNAESVPTQMKSD